MENNKKIDLIEVKKIIKDKIKIISLILILCTILGIIYSSFLIKPMYSVTSRVLVDKGGNSLKELLPDTDVIKDVAKELNIEYKNVKDSIETSYDKTTNIIERYVNYENNIQSYNIINKYIELLELKLEDVYGIEQYEVLKKPEIPNNPYNINHIKDIIMALAIGIIIVCIYVAIIYSNLGLINQAQIESLKIRFLGYILNDNTKKKVTKRKNEELYKMKRIVTNIELNEKARNPKAVLITGVSDLVDLTSVTKKVVTTYSELKDKILVINSTQEGENNKLKELKNEKITIKTEKDLNINKKNLISKDVINIINNLKDEYDIIFINSDAIIENEIATVWSNIVDGVVLVAEYRKTKEAELIEAKKYIENVKGNVIGIILNNYEK